jgi:AcrR family transcriptional regulator
MRSISTRFTGTPPDDLTARARIRDSAIECFAALGFAATVRQIAAHAGVSAGLITHHFGSKEALRQACDTEVLRRVLEIKLGGIRRSPNEAVAMIAQLDGFGASFGYTLRSVREGGPAGREFLENLIDDARMYVAEAVASGTLLPSVDEEARVRMLVTQSIGGMIVQLTLSDEVDLSDGRALIRRVTESSSLVLVELYTQGLLADHRLLDAYREQAEQQQPTSAGGDA